MTISRKETREILSQDNLSEMSSAYLRSKEALSSKIREYRKLLNDNTTLDEKIQKRIEYLEALCRNIIRTELRNYVSNLTVKTQ